MNANPNRHAIDFTKNPNSGVKIHKVVSRRILIVESRSGFGVWVDGSVHKALNKDKGHRAEQWADALNSRHLAAE